MVTSWAACCISRAAENEDPSLHKAEAILTPQRWLSQASNSPCVSGRRPGRRAATWAHPAQDDDDDDDDDEALDFFDCLETENELLLLAQKQGVLGGAGAGLGGGQALRMATFSAAPALQLPRPPPQGGPPLPGCVDEATPISGRADCCTVNGCVAAATAAAALGADCCGELGSELAAAAAVLERTRNEWSRHVMEFRKDALAELQWADLSQAQRMLKANIGDVQKAVEMFMKALEIRARDRDLFHSMRCDARCDARIIGKDMEEHPVVYMCARSFSEPLRCQRAQLICTFEAACRAASDSPKGEGRVIFVMDMHGLRPQNLMDPAAIKDLADMFGTVYAERIFKIIIVDFSRAAQAVWFIIKQVLAPVTRNKFAFVGEAKALDICSRDFDGPTFERVQSAFQINRDPTSSPSDRALHARRTTINSVPLGPPLC